MEKFITAAGSYYQTSLVEISAISQEPMHKPSTPATKVALWGMLARI